GGALGGVGDDVVDAVLEERGRDLRGGVRECRDVAGEQRLIDGGIRESAVDGAARRAGAFQHARGRGQARVMGATRAVSQHEHHRTRLLHPAMEAQLMPWMSHDERRTIRRKHAGPTITAANGRGLCGRPLALPSDRSSTSTGFFPRQRTALLYRREVMDIKMSHRTLFRSFVFTLSLSTAAVAGAQV